jgi:hypothetical protein
LCFAAAAGLGANSTVFVAAGVTLTFRSASGATLDTGLELHVDELAIATELPDKDASGKAARAGAILVQPNALPQRINVLRSQARVRTTSASELALEACFDAIFQQASIEHHAVRSG